MNLIERAHRIVTRALEAVVALCFLFIFLLTVTLVLLRYGFNSSIVGGSEAMNYLFIYTTALGAAIAVGRGSHIRISFFIDLLPDRWRRGVEILNQLLVAAFNLILVYHSAGWIRATGGFESPVLRIPNRLVQFSVPLGCSLAVLYCLHNIVTRNADEAYSRAGRAA